MAEYIVLTVILGAAAAYLAVALRNTIRSLKNPCSTGCGGCRSCPLAGAAKHTEKPRP